jgi:hypothetical protein
MTSLLRKVVVGFLIVTSLAWSGTAFAQGRGFFRVDRVQAFDTDVWRVQVGRSFQVVVDGDGDTDLDLYVYDAVTGRFLGSDDDDTDYCVVDGYSDSGQIVIRIKNRGNVWNRYSLSVR